MKHILFFTLCLTAAMTTASAVVILSDTFDGVDKSGSAATFDSWDTVNGIDVPAASLSFFDANGTPAVSDDGASPLSFFDVTADQIDVNQNMNNGGWRTSITLDLDGSTSAIVLTTLTLDMRLTTGSGTDNTTSSKNGRMTLELVGSTSGVLGTIDTGDASYPTVNYQRVLDLSSLATLGTTETYTINISALGSGHGHNKSLRGLSLEGNVTAVPEPSVVLYALLGAGLVLLRRRR